MKTSIRNFKKPKPISCAFINDLLTAHKKTQVTLFYEQSKVKSITLPTSFKKDLSSWECCCEPPNKGLELVKKTLSHIHLRFHNKQEIVIQ